MARSSALTKVSLNPRRRSSRVLNLHKTSFEEFEPEPNEFGLGFETGYVDWLEPPTGRHGADQPLLTRNLRSDGCVVNWKEQNYSACLSLGVHECAN